MGFQRRDRGQDPGVKRVGSLLKVGKERVGGGILKKGQEPRSKGAGSLQKVGELRCEVGFQIGGRGQDPGVKRVGRLLEAGEERVGGGILKKGQEAGTQSEGSGKSTGGGRREDGRWDSQGSRTRRNISKIEYVAKEKAHRNRYGIGGDG